MSSQYWFKARHELLNMKPSSHVYEQINPCTKTLTQNHHNENLSAHTIHTALTRRRKNEPRNATSYQTPVSPACYRSRRIKQFVSPRSSQPQPHIEQLCPPVANHSTNVGTSPARTFKQTVLYSGFSLCVVLRFLEMKKIKTISSRHIRSSWQYKRSPQHIRNKLYYCRIKTNDQHGRSLNYVYIVQMLLRS